MATLDVLAKIVGVAFGFALGSVGAQIVIARVERLRVDGRLNDLLRSIPHMDVNERDITEAEWQRRLGYNEALVEFSRRASWKLRDPNLLVPTTTQNSDEHVCTTGRRDGDA